MTPELGTTGDIHRQGAMAPVMRFPVLDMLGATACTTEKATR